MYKYLKRKTLSLQITNNVLFKTEYAVALCLLCLIAQPRLTLYTGSVNAENEYLPCLQ